jgi:hypothetical protein
MPGRAGGRGGAGAAVDPAAVAAVAGREPAVVLAALDEAAAAGIVAAGAFTHDLIREVARLEVPTADRLAVHARMADYLQPDAAPPAALPAGRGGFGRSGPAQPGRCGWPWHRAVADTVRLLTDPSLFLDDVFLGKPDAWWPRAGRHKGGGWGRPGGGRSGT